MNKSQEQLEKIILEYYENQQLGSEIGCKSLASAILSAMRIDVNRLHYLLEERNPMGIPLWERGADSISLKIASHAQEIIKFEEETNAKQ